MDPLWVLCSALLPQTLTPVATFSITSVVCKLFTASFTDIVAADGWNWERFTSLHTPCKTLILVLRGEGFTKMGLGSGALDVAHH